MLTICLLPAAGYGTRFLPATKAMPKEMLPIVNKPLVQYAVEEALEAGLHQIGIVTGRGKRSLEDHFDISYERQADRQLHLLLHPSGGDEGPGPRHPDRPPAAR